MQPRCYDLKRLKKQSRACRIWALLFQGVILRTIGNLKIGGESWSFFEKDNNVGLFLFAYEQFMVKSQNISEHLCI